MANDDLDLLKVERGSIVAPAGCGKTQLIADSLKRHPGRKPILILTHTNSGVAALRARLGKAGVQPSAFRLNTIDGWAMRLLRTFPHRGGHDTRILELRDRVNDYPAIRKAALELLDAGHIADVIGASYASLVVDEYQDCNVPQHAIVCSAASTLKTCVLGDPMQAIFGWPGNRVADWDGQVCDSFPTVGELRIPWRWRNAGTEDFGQWLLDVRRRLLAGEKIDFRGAPPEVVWVQLDGSEDHQRQIHAALTKPATKHGSVLIICDSKKPSRQQQFASQIPGATTVEAVDLRDLIEFAQSFDFQSPDALRRVVDFSTSLLTGARSADLLARVDVLQRGAARKEGSAAELAAIRFAATRTPSAALELLAELKQGAGVRAHRQTIFRAFQKALQASNNDCGAFPDAAVRMREENRLLGRLLPKRAVGSTLLLKGLEAEICVVLDAGELDARNLYVAMTRGSHGVVVCSQASSLPS